MEAAPARSFSPGGNPAGIPASYFGLDLEDIRNYTLADLGKITVSSKREESPQDAAASVTVYSAQDITDLGYYTLADLANITAGYSAYTIYGEQVFETRGQKAGSFNNNKHLLLIDGIPINNAKNYKVSTETELPLYFARRVEFLKGPASALYGTGAFFGVVNVVPKVVAADGIYSEFKATVGNMDNSKRLMANVLRKDAAVESRISAGYSNKDSSRDFVGVNHSPLQRNYDRQRSIFLNLSYGIRSGSLEGFTPGFIYMQKNGGLGEHWMGDFSSELDDLTWEEVIPYIKYDRQFSDAVSFNSYLKFNSSMERGVSAPLTRAAYLAYAGTGQVLSIYDNRVQNAEILAETRWQFSDSLHLTSGVNYDTRYQTKGSDSPSSFTDYISADAGNPYRSVIDTGSRSGVFRTYSVYSQLQQEYPFLKGTLLTAGFREDMFVAPSERFSQFSPRIGVVQRVSDSLNVKFLYGTALRVPGNKEVVLNNSQRVTAVLNGDSPSFLMSLKPETFKSGEAGLNYQSGPVNAAVTFFSNQTKDSLDGASQVIGGNSYNYFRNSDGLTKAHGFEAETAWYLAGRRSKVFANYSWTRAKDPSGKDVNDVPTQTANLGVSGRAGRRSDVSGAAVIRYVEGFQAAGRQHPDGYLVTDTNIVVPAGRSFNFEMRVKNVFNQFYMLPKNGIPDIPMPRRSFFFSLDYSF